MILIIAMEAAVLVDGIFVNYRTGRCGQKPFRSEPPSNDEKEVNYRFVHMMCIIFVDDVYLHMCVL